ncbi:MAG: hypothetical protein VW338_00820 [Rhodospirillaceae bacterium]
MKPYRVEGGPVQFGPGDILGLTKVQFAIRAGRLEDQAGAPITVEQLQKLGDLIVCRPTQIVEFKAGEVIQLASAPGKPQAARLTPIDHDDGIRRPPPEPEPKKAAAKPKKSAA